jgi:hypothetical protein
MDCSWQAQARRAGCSHPPPLCACWARCCSEWKPGDPATSIAVCALLLAVAAAAALAPAWRTTRVDPVIALRYE